MQNGEDTTENADATNPDAADGDDYVSDRRFADFPISSETLRGITDHGYVTATPVQAATIEAALAGRDMLVRAKTGTGKTAAFVVPILEAMPVGSRTPHAIVLAPTRELAQQIAEEARALAAHRDLVVAILVGGMAMGPQQDALATGAGLVVGTPGRVLDLYRRGNLDLGSMKIACLDEADEMLSMGFFEDVTAILDATASDRQVLLFSATISGDTQRLVSKYLRDPEEVMLSTDEDRVENIDHILYENPPGEHKVRSLMYVLDLEDPEAALIFCNTREDAATVAAFLDRQGLDAQLLSGELPQARRNKVMKAVKAGAVRFLVATDVAARGIDISDLGYVINYSLPQDPKVYLHRTGRTGRMGGRGMAINLVSATDLGTRKTLENVHMIDFTVRPFPSIEEVVALRVERQAKQIRDAMGTIAFEAYLPTVRALLDHEDGEYLLAAALRAFFQWNRTRKALLDVVTGGDDEPEDTGRSMRPERTGRGPRRDSDRDRDRPKKGRTDKKSRDKGDRDGRKRERTRSRRDEPRDSDSVTLDDLEDLLVAEPVASPEPAVATDDALVVSDEEPKKKKRRRRRRKKPGESEEGEGTRATSDDASDEVVAPVVAKAPEADLPDDLDALLSLD